MRLPGALNARFAELRSAAASIQEELCSVDDAIELFRKQDDPSACLLLEESLESVVTLLRCAETWANVTRPLDRNRCVIH